MSSRETAPWVSGLTFIVGAVVGLWGFWCVVIGFIGGTMPIIGIETQGSLGLGLFMLFFGEPILMTVVYWIGLLLLMLVGMIFSRKS